MVLVMDGMFNRSRPKENIKELSVERWSCYNILQTRIWKVCNFSRFSSSKTPQYRLKLHKSLTSREINTAT